MKKHHYAAVLLLVIAFTVPLSGETAVIPGDVDQICSYTNFFYNNPSEDFIYFLNDRLLFTEKPDGKIMPGGVRNRLLKIVRWHKVIKRSLRRYKRDNRNMIVINTSEPEGYKQTSIILNMLGLRLAKTPEGKYDVTQNPSAAVPDYFRFTAVTPDLITRQLNRTGYFYFKLREDEVPIPWKYWYLREITGLKVDKHSFFETLLKNEDFSLLLGTLYRLSDREIDRIGGLVTDPPYGAWKQIYGDKKFLMGLFLLSQALRAAENGLWKMPGGTEAEPFWNRLVENDGNMSPVEFLRRLAVKDDGKLNYLFLFASFLSPETQKVLFTGPNARKMPDVYQRISLSDNEKLTESRLPRLRTSNFYTLLYALRVDVGSNRVYFPPAVEKWSKLITASPIEEEEPPMPDEAVETLVKTEEEIKGPLNKVGPSGGGRKTGFYLAVNGSGEFLNAGDFDDLIDNNGRLNGDLVDIEKSPFFKGLGVELGYDFGRIAVGVEVGTLSKAFNARVDNDIVYGKWNRSFSAVPLALNLYLTVIDSSVVGVYLTGGGGIYFGKLEDTWDWEYRGYLRSVQRGLETGTGNRYGFHVGGGIEIAVSKGFCFFIQGRYRFVDFRDMVGEGMLVNRLNGPTSTTTYGGDLYYLTSNETGLTDFFPGTGYDSGLNSARKAVLKLRGFALTLGFKLRLF